MTFQPQPRDIDWDIEEQHLDEAEFMLQVWDAALEAPDYTLAEIAAGPQRRLLAHVDALAIGESVVLERMLLPTIEDPHAAYERVAAAVLACSRPAHAVSVLANTTEVDQRRGIIRALESWPDPQLDATLIRALGSARGPGVACLLELLARRRVICAVTGLATDDERFWKPPAPRDNEAEALPERGHDDLSADLVPSPEAALPRPEPDEIARWWRDCRNRFDPALRYLDGKPITVEVIIDALWRAPARRRHNLALELALRTGGAAAIDTRVLSARQHAQLERLSTLEPIDFQRGHPIRQLPCGR